MASKQRFSIDLSKGGRSLRRRILNRRRLHTLGHCVVLVILNPDEDARAPNMRLKLAALLLKELLCCLTFETFAAA